MLDTEGAFAAATGIDVSVLGPHGSIEAIGFHWYGDLAVLSVTGRDEIAADVLRNKAAEILNAGSVKPPEPMKPPEPTPAHATFEQQTKFSLARVRFVGTYADLGQLVCDLADQVRQVRGSMDYVYVALTEHGQTVTVHHLGELTRITDRDVHQLRDLSISLASSRDGPSLSLYIRGREMTGNASGPDEAPVRALRAAADDLLRDRSSLPHWLRYRQVLAAGVVLEVLGLVLFFVPGVWPFGLALIATACILLPSPFYLPDVELLSPGEKTRWSRWSRYILALVIAWLIGSLALPLFTR